MMQISVASGKGGTGKTTVAVNLALAADAVLNGGTFDKSAQTVQILDCDVEEPNCHIFLEPKIERRETVSVPIPEISLEKCNLCGLCAKICEFHAIMIGKSKILLFQELCHGCGACSYLCPQGAITEKPREVGVLETGIGRGIFFAHGILNPGESLSPPVISGVKKQALKNTFTVLDTPPGVSCNMVESVQDTDLCVLVTEPTPFGLHDLKLAVDTARNLDVPVCCVINRCDLGYRGVLEFCKDQNIPVAAQIPLDRNIAELYAKGKPLVTSHPKYLKVFSDLFKKIQDLAIQAKGHK